MIDLKNCPFEIQEKFSPNRPDRYCNCSYLFSIKEEEIKYLEALIKDKYYCVRAIVALKIDISFLPLMMRDEEYLVRLEVAKRINFLYLSEMLNNEEDIIIINIIKNRLSKNITSKNQCNICHKGK